MTVHVHQDGLLDLRFANVFDGRTVIAGRRQRFPLRTTVATYPDDDRQMPWVIVQNPTGGIFPGDRLRLSFELEPGARAHVRNQSATKLYAGEGEAASQDLVLTLADGAFGEYFGDVLIPHAGARYGQTTTIDAARTAFAVVAETLAAGRTGHGERFQFDHIRLSTTVTIGGCDVCRDVLDVEPGRRHPASRGLFGPMTHLSTILVLCPDVDPERVARAVDVAIAAAAGSQAGTTLLPSGAGVLVRALSPRASAARAVVVTAWRVLRAELTGHLPPARLV